MRVMFWSAVFWPSIGGVQTMASDLLPALRAKGHEFVVVTEQGSPDLPAEDEYEGIPVYRLPFAAVLRDVNRLMDVRSRVIRLKREFAPDLFHSFAVSANDFLHLTTQDAYPAPWLVTLHGAWPNSCDLFVRRTLTAADWIVGCSTAILQRGCESAPCISSHSSVIYNAQRPAAGCVSLLRFNPPVLLYVGRLSREKGVDVALAAFALLHALVPETRFLIAGDGPERGALERQADHLNLGAAARFLGWVAPKEVPALIETASIVVLPSREESFPVVGLQAAIMGRPVVATRTGGVPEMILDRETGLLVRTEDPKALADAIVGLLRRPDEAQRMGEAARRRALEVFSFDRHVEAYDELYRRLAPATPKSARS
jgi:glycosyltransferase involved in cell wall biosynthesis